MLEKLHKKYADVMPYLFFGVCTTLVNVLAYWVCARVFRLGTIPSSILAWVLAVLFAYITNRKWVFHSQETEAGRVFKEICSFFACRLVTGIVDWVCMYVFVDLMMWNDMAVKIAANILVIILNYVASKWVVFRRKPK